MLHGADAEQLTLLKKVMKVVIIIVIVVMMIIIIMLVVIITIIVVVIKVRMMMKVSQYVKYKLCCNDNVDNLFETHRLFPCLLSHATEA